MKKTWILIFAFALLFNIPGNVFASHSGDLDCSDFDTWEEAKKHWDEHGYTKDNDPERLDGHPANGVPCERLKTGGGDDDGSSDDGSTDDGSSDDGSNDEDSTDDESTNNGSDSNTDNSKEQKGGKMPKTATGLGNFLMMGASFLLAGLALLFFRRQARN